MSSFERDCIQAQCYLGSPTGTLWKWEEEGRVLSWNNGSTIAFAEEIEYMLEGFVPGGLPSFSAILLVIAATRRNFKGGDAVWEDVRHIAECYGLSWEHQMLTDSWFDECELALDRIHNLPEDSHKGMEARRTLAMQVLEDAPRVCVGDSSQAVLRAFLRGVPERLLVREADKQALYDQWITDLDAIRKGMEHLKDEDLERRRDTGLADEVGEAPLDLSLQEQILRLMDSLADDDEFEGLARLTAQLIAAVHLPRPLSAQQDLPLGGFSDISNKGPLDRLLLSEMANDDLVLMVRIALNEALYLKRETPPNNQISDCAVLVDAGIRSWGIPRVFSTAVALAAGATAGSQRALAFYQGVRGDVVLSDLSSREGLVAHLGVLDAAPHPGESLKALLARPEAYTEVLLITQRDVMADETFRKLLRTYPDLLLHVATVDQDGQFKFMEIGRHGTKLLRQAQIDLQDILFSKRKKVSKLLDEAERYDHLPAIFSLKEFPLFLPAKLEAQHAVVLEGVLYALTNDGRMLVRDDDDRGCRQLTAGMWKGVRFIEAHYQSGWIHAVAYKKPGKYQLFSYKPSLDQLIEVELHSTETGRPTYVGIFNEYVYAVIGKGILVWHIGTGNSLGLLPWELDNWNFHKRFFRVDGAWCQLVVNEGTPQFEILLQRPLHEMIKMVFTSVEDERPMCVFKNWEIRDYDENVKKLKPTGESFNPDRKRTMKAQGDIRRVCCFSKNGLNMLVQDEGNTMWEIGVMTGQARSTWLRPDAMVVPEPGIGHMMSNMVDLRQQFLRVAISLDGTLVLESKKHHYWSLLLDEKQSGLMLKRTSNLRNQPVMKTLNLKPFLKTSSPHDSLVRLRVAQFGESIRIFLDSRGLLHVKPMRPDALEFTLVLCDNDVSAWCSDGTVSGSEYFLGKDREKIDAVSFQEKLKEELVHAHLATV